MCGTRPRSRAPARSEAAAKTRAAKVDSDKLRAEAVDRTELGQRRINVMWEGTQGILAVTLVFTACYALLNGIALPPEYWLLLGVVVNSYYSRTNHTRVGGVGTPPEGGR